MRVKILLLPLVFHLVTQKKKPRKKKIKKQDCILVCERNAKKKIITLVTHHLYYAYKNHCYDDIVPE